MTSEVTITVADAVDHCLTVPIQAIIGSAEMGETRKCFVMNHGKPEEREIVVGLSNDKEAEITSGLKEADEVVTNPKLIVGEKMKTRQAGELNAAREDSASGGPPEG